MADDKPMSELISQVMEKYTRESPVQHRPAPVSEVDERDRHLSARGIPSRFRDRIVAGDFTDTHAIGAVRRFLADTAARTLLICGPKGTGKTFAACWMVAQRCPDELRRIKGQWPTAPEFVSARELERVSRYEGERLSGLERVSMLAIDDLGMEYVDRNFNFLATLDGLFDARHGECLRTLLTTNLTAGQFRERYGERIADRIRETGHAVELVGDSMRRRT